MRRVSSAGGSPGNKNGLDENFDLGSAGSMKGRGGRSPAPGFRISGRG
jgi:hypothetical protein